MNCEDVLFYLVQVGHICKRYVGLPVLFDVVLQVHRTLATHEHLEKLSEGARYLVIRW